jgi:hypothetical protein
MDIKSYGDGLTQNIELHSATLDSPGGLGPVPSLARLVTPTASTPGAR